MQKNVLVLGWSRAGKTTLTRRLKDELHYNIINSYVALDALGKAYPQLLGNGEGPPALAPSALTPFIAHYCCSLARYAKAWNEPKFAADIELGIYDFDKVFPLMDKLLEMGGLKIKEEFIYIGLVNTGSGEDVFNSIKKYDTAKDWSYTQSDEALKAMCNDYPALTQAYTELFIKYGFKIYDTSGDRKRVFDKIVDDIKIENGMV
jgi:hypothetical protein